MNTTLQHHPTLSPSKLDIIAVCPVFVSGPISEAAEKGTDQHGYAEILLKNNATAMEVQEVIKNTAMEVREVIKKLSADDRDNVEWYVEYVKANASGELEVEQTLELLGANFEQITFGTIDAAAGPDIFDYKSDREEREHKRQMAAYALMRMRQKGLSQVTTHICYGKLRKVVKRTFTEAEAWDLVESAIAVFYSPDRQPFPCEYCGWCGNIKTCRPMTKAVDILMAHIAPESSEGIVVWEPSEMADLAMVGHALNVARIVGAWADSVEKHAKIMMEGGNQIPGWSILERAGAREVTDILKCFQLCGLDEETFLKSCKVKIGELEEAYAIAKGVNKAKAKRNLKELLADVVEQKKPIKILTRQKEG